VSFAERFAERNPIFEAIFVIKPELKLQKEMSVLQKGLQKDNPILEIRSLPELYLLEAKSFSFFLAGWFSNRVGYLAQWIRVTNCNDLQHWLYVAARGNYLPRL
jgi:hypothetical protein